MNVMLLIDELNAFGGDRTAAIEAKLAEAEQRVNVLLALKRFVGHESSPVASSPPGKSPAGPIALRPAGSKERASRSVKSSRIIEIAREIGRRGPLRTSEAAAVVGVTPAASYTYLKTPHFACENKRWTLTPSGRNALRSADANG